MSNKKPGRAESMLAMCHVCTHGYEDGPVCCGKPKCPMFPWMPYRAMQPDSELLAYNPKRQGFYLKEETKKGVQLREDHRDIIEARSTMMRTKLESLGMYKVGARIEDKRQQLNDNLLELEGPQQSVFYTTEETLIEDNEIIDDDEWA